MLPYLVLGLILYMFTAPVQGWMSDDKFGDKLEKMYRLWHDDCMKKTGAPENTVELIRSGIFPDDPRMKAYNRCLYTDVMDKNARLLPEKLDYYIYPAFGKTGLKMYLDCEEKVKDEANYDDRVYKMQQCIYEANPDVSFNFF
uniref:Odorant binding protein 21 n=1 Tax=Colaphellus bowringi TaxID=561076 RepID=A0A0S3J2X3_9CUCU|nr:odorant binding protein 21 [Colaphellus bowringi]